jgi:hypothetical protein
MNRSPERNTFQLKAYLERCEADGTAPNEDYIELYRGDDGREVEKQDQWKINNLEYDLRSTKWICDKAKAREEYAQNIYAALCNNDFVKNDVWPLLQDQRWSCSWRYAGGIVADMRQEGDYIDWYCSGIKGGIREEDLNNMTPDEIKRHHWVDKHFVSESHITDEIREDLFRLGWIVNNTENNDD